MSSILFRSWIFRAPGDRAMAGAQVNDPGAPIGLAGRDQAGRARRRSHPRLEALEGISPPSASAGLGTFVHVSPSVVVKIDVTSRVSKQANPAAWNFLATALETRLGELLGYNGASITTSFRKSTIGQLEVALHNAGVPRKPGFAVYSFLTSRVFPSQAQTGLLTVGKNEAKSLDEPYYLVSITAPQGQNPIISVAPTYAYQLSRYYTSPLYPPLGG